MREYLPTFADLVDRLSIDRMKAIFIPEGREPYEEEMKLILHDLDRILLEKKLNIDATAIHAILVIMLANRFIWENESKARLGGPEQDKLLKLTHSINGVRNNAKNVLAQRMGERKDLKVDSLAAGLPSEFGDWEITY